MQRRPRKTKRERHQLDPFRAARLTQDAPHIHCIACGRHLNPGEFSAAPPTAKYLSCQHASRFPACADCEVAAQRRIDEHDRTGQPVATAEAWH
jgi:hypothetical protein